jgi:hypothetical protein
MVGRCHTAAIEKSLIALKIKTNSRTGFSLEKVKEIWLAIVLDVDNASCLGRTAS